MTLTTSRRHKRSIALTMLLVWVFALLSGVANACLTEPRGEAVHLDMHALQSDHPVQAAATSHEAAVRAHHDEQPTKAPCQKSCDASSQTLLKQLPKFDTPDWQALVAAPPGQAGDLHLMPAGLVRARLAAVPPPAPPPRVLFSRLAL